LENGSQKDMIAVFHNKTCRNFSQKWSEKYFAINYIARPHFGGIIFEAEIEPS